MTSMVICYACMHQREVFTTYRYNICGNCGARNPIKVRGQNTVGKRWWVEWYDKEGHSPEHARQFVYSGLKWYAEQRNYKQGWAARKYLLIFGEWPSDDVKQLDAEPPLAPLMDWIKRENALWKKQKRAEEKANPTVVEPLPMPAEGLPSFMNADDWAVKL